MKNNQIFYSNQYIYIYMDIYILIYIYIGIPYLCSLLVFPIDIPILIILVVFTVSEATHARGWAQANAPPMCG